LILIGLFELSTKFGRNPLIICNQKNKVISKLSTFHCAMKLLTFFTFYALTRSFSLNIQRNVNIVTKIMAAELGSQESNFKSGFVTILGNPNVGKSTLLNCFLKEKLSIVSPKPQTTRHRILGVLTESNYQIIFSDTPGILLPSYKLQDAMMESVSLRYFHCFICS
jgi:ribosome biogenesis GTPase A